jgi:hypothetical protein
VNCRDTCIRRLPLSHWNSRGRAIPLQEAIHQTIFEEDEVDEENTTRGSSGSARGRTQSAAKAQRERTMKLLERSSKTTASTSQVSTAIKLTSHHPLEGS